MFTLALLQMWVLDVFVTELVAGDWHQALTRSLSNKMCFS